MPSRIMRKGNHLLGSSGSIMMSDQGMIQTRSIFGITISDMTREAALSRFQHAIDTHQHGKIAFCNAHTANLAYDNAQLQATLASFTVLADGIGVDIAARILHKKPFSANLNGTDFVPALIASCTRPVTVAMLGAEPGVALRARDALQQKFPQHRVTTVQHGFATPDETAAFLRNLEQEPVDILLVAMGNPRQEQFIAQRVTGHHATLAIGVGALFDFIAGEVPRAPQWIRSLRMEWLFRLAQEPARLFGRYVLGNPLFLWRVLLTRTGWAKQ
jgi:exopolysaccharide biosynthesis WecB/TagA/CpsF family protein